VKNDGCTNRDAGPGPGGDHSGPMSSGTVSVLEGRAEGESSLTKPVLNGSGAVECGVEWARRVCAEP
jgi:hypothetical protein